MAKLADVTSEVRILLKILAASFIVITILFLFFKGGTILKNVLFPTPPAPPEQKFGRLPLIPFPDQQPVKLDYKVNTLSGNLNEFGNQMKVYKTKTVKPSLVALQTARDRLANLGFTDNETKVSESTYQWSQANGDRMQYNIINNNFNLITNFLAEPSPTTLGPAIIEKVDVYSNAMFFLEELGENTDDLNEEFSTLIYLKLVDGQLVQADSVGDAQFSRLDIFQNNIDKNYKIYYPGLDESTMYFIYRSNDSVPRIVNAAYVHTMADKSSSSTYPIITTQEAFDKLKAGKAIVFNKSGKSLIDITDVTLGYYLGEENQPYLLPIFVFTGKDFTAYVQAVPSSSIED